MNRSTGQATVELVLCLPVLVLLATVLVEVGVLAVEKARVWQAAREGARVAVVDPDASHAAAAARRVGPLPMEVSIDPPGHLRRQGDPLVLTVVHRREGTVPLVGALFDGLELKARAAMRIEVP